MEREGPVTRLQSKRCPQQPHHAKVPGAQQKQAPKRAEAIPSRAKLAPLDSNRTTTRQQEKQPVSKPASKGLPARRERQANARDSQDTTNTNSRAASRRQGCNTRQTSNTTARSKTGEAGVPSAHPSTRDDARPAKNPRKDCHSLLPDVVTDLTSLPSDPSIEDDLHDPQQCAEYVQDIYRSLLVAETRPVFRVGPDLLSRQTEVEGSHRRVLVDWLVQVHTRFSLLPDTLHICMDILDRYLQLVNVPRKELQLVGVTALFLASKYEEIYPNSISDFAYMTADTYTTQQIRDKERDILRRLDYQLGKPTPLTFLRRYSKLMNTSTTVHNLAKYFIEVSYLSAEGRALLPSQCAVGALLLAAKVNTSREGGGGDLARLWGLHMEKYTWYSRGRAAIFTHQVLGCVLSYTQLCAKDVRFSAVKEKYSSHFQNVAASPRLRNILELLAAKTSLPRERQLGAALEQDLLFVL